MVDRLRVVLKISGLAALAAVTGCMVVATPGAVGPGGAAGLEYGTKRNGSDYTSFDVASGRPEACRDACMADANCAAFTFVNPGVQGPAARCWLKNPIPNPNPDSCCVSGVKPPMVAAAGASASLGRLEPVTNRAGSDYNSFDLPSPNPELCRDACMRDAPCLAFT